LHGLVLTIRRDILDAIIAHARSRHPYMSCGLVAGECGSDLPSRFIPMRNAQESTTFWQFDPVEQVRVWREMDARDEEPVILYYSQEDPNAYPSRTTIAMASESQAHYLIVSTADPERVVYRSFRIVDGAVSEDEIVITDAVPEGYGRSAGRASAANSRRADPEAAMATPYDSTADTLRHSLRVGELMGEPIKELIDRSVRHDLSKTRDPELAVYDRFVPRLREATYGSAEHAELVAAMGEGLDHHYANNRHHPEHFPDGISGMTLVDLLEMLADWMAATERGGDGDRDRALQLNGERFGVSAQLMDVLVNTARRYQWIGADAETE
jgi:proteasome lid subunit RPN8/RPN11